MTMPTSVLAPKLTAPDSEVPEAIVAVRYSMSVNSDIEYYDRFMASLHHVDIHGTRAHAVGLVGQILL